MNPIITTQIHASMVCGLSEIHPRGKKNNIAKLAAGLFSRAGEEVGGFPGSFFWGARYLLYLEIMECLKI